MTDFFGLTYFALICGGIAYAIRKNIPSRKRLVAENADLKRRISDLRGQLETAQLMATFNAVNDDERERYQTVIRLVRDTILFYDNSNGRISASHAIAMLKDAIIRYRADCLDIGKEDLDELNWRIAQHVEEMRSKGFKTN